VALGSARSERQRVTRARPEDDSAVEAAPAVREARARDFVRLKLRLQRNSLRGQVWRVLALVGGMLFGFWIAVLAVFGLSASGTGSREIGFVVATFAGAAVTLGWSLVPLLFFGVDETLDPARFALLPVRRRVLTRGMLAAAFIGVPAVVTLIGSGGLVIAAWIRFGPVEAGVAAVGVVAGLVLGVLASRAVTSAFAAMLRSRRVRDLAAVIIAVLASSVAPLQWAIMSAADRGSLDQAVRFAEVLSWTPFSAAYVLPFDVAEGRWWAVAVRAGLTVGAILLLRWWWSRTIESAMIGTTANGPAKPTRGAAGGAVANLMSASLRRVVGTSVYGAIVARESRFWWRDARRRASLISILMASAVLPIALNLAARSGGDGANTLPGLGFSFAISMAGTMGGMLLANQFAFDGSAYAAHLLAQVPGRVELRARATAAALATVPVQIAVVVAVAVIAGNTAQLPAGLGLLAASFGAAIASASVLSVIAPYALPDNTNPFALNSGGGSAKGLLAFVAVLGTLVICMPVVVVAYLLADTVGGAWLVLVIGLAYGVGAARLGTYIAGDVLERRGPEVLISITPRR
jgi:ABC-2 type transport system permease protein